MKNSTGRKQAQTPTEMDENAILGRVSLVTISGNVILSVFKMFAGISGQSGAMVSDAIHSLSDVITTFVAFLGVKLSKKDADSSHPYGHERLECVASLILGSILLATGLGIGKAGLHNILAGHYENLAIPGVIALIAAMVSIAIKEAMYWYTRYYAKRLNSTAFMADAWHHRSDAFSSVGSLIGVGGAMLGFPVLDSIASVVICLFILKVGIVILKDAIQNMVDTPCDKDYEKKLADYIALQQDISHIDLLRTRKFGNKVYVDLEIAVDGDKPLRDAHAIAESIHNNVEQKFPNIKHIMIHVNPST